MNVWSKVSGVSFTDGDYTFSVASTVEDRMSCYHVRYHALTIQLGDERYADHENRTYIDPWDDDDTLVLIAKHKDGTAVGTVRCHWRKVRPFPVDELYDYPQYAALVGCSVSAIDQHVVLFDRGGVLPTHQNFGIYPRLDVLAERISRLNDIKCHVGLVAHGNSRMLKVLESIGWKTSGRSVQHNSWAGVEVLKRLD